MDERYPAPATLVAMLAAGALMACHPPNSGIDITDFGMGDHIIMANPGPDLLLATDSLAFTSASIPAPVSQPPGRPVGSFAGNVLAGAGQAARGSQGHISTLTMQFHATCVGMACPGVEFAGLIPITHDFDLNLLRIGTLELSDPDAGGQLYGSITFHADQEDSSMLEGKSMLTLFLSGRFIEFNQAATVLVRQDLPAGGD